MFIVLLPLEGAFGRVVNPLYFWASTFFLRVKRSALIVENPSSERAEGTL